MDSSVKDSVERTVYFDYLRVAAAFAVMIIHVSAQNWYKTDVNGIEWWFFNFYDSLAQWGVSIFVMISGALFLQRDIPLKQLYSKYILRLVISFVAWSTFYSLFEKGSTMHKISLIVQGHYHMWFILMIIGLYMCLPFIKPIIQGKKTKYFLLLSFIFAVIVPSIVKLTSDFGNEWMKKSMNAIKNITSDMNMTMVMGHVGFFALGYYLNQITLTRKQRIILYFLGLLGAALTVGLDLSIALKTQAPCSRYYDRFTINMFFVALGVHTWFKYRNYNNSKMNAFIQKLSKYSYGAYLIHVLVLNQLRRLGLDTLSFHPALSVIVIGIIVFTLSFGASALLNQIPIVKKYLV